ncbi:drug resistance transporter, EmrB/QacA subfamily [Micromonospora echinofusca]|uniref:Drug resistance transporter, EmrB/QacA subfamily n=1 Tax=Micromonospora echinofusca TaxID=47858 RepID=A0A1C5GKE3_MICEH|nr:MFS transporter [Micromonospora echinofusca]SCG19586.1 drug resistance transporter, EmrB/QacA subfamily [Micromonospora echinofusca]
MTETAPALRLGTAHGRGTLLAAVLASGMVFLDTTVVNVALPHLGADLDATVAGLQWTVNGYLLMLAAFVLLGGALGDRFGRRRVFLVGVVWFTLASLLCGLAQGTEWLIAARFLQGAGGALLTPGSLSVLQASFHPDDRGRAIGAWSGLSGVSTALGPFLGGWLIDALSWRWIFFLNLPLAVLVLLATLRWVPESRDKAASRTGTAGRGRRRFDVAGALLGALALAGVTYALIDAPVRGFDSVPVLAAALAGVAGAVAFVLVERRRGDAAMLPTGLFGSRLFSVLNVFTVLVYAALGGFTFFLAVYLQNVVGWSALLTGVALLPMTVLLLVGSARAGALSARIGPRLPLTVGPVVAAAGLVLLRGVDPGASYWRDVLPGVVLFGIGLTLVVAPLTASVLAAVDDRFAGVASGFNNAASRAGGLLAVAALPLLVGLSGAGYAQPAALTDAYRGAMLWCAGLLLAGAAMAVLLVHRPASEEGHPA